MKMRTIKLTPKFLSEVIQGKAATVASNLPSDTQILDIKFDLSSNQVSIVIRSDSFEDSSDLYPIPEFKVDFASTATKITTSQPMTSKAESKQIVTAKPVASISKSAQPSNIADKMAGEFSPEQRKLLSFKTEGEYIIVKPTQFLKEEWEDINEVVRSLGGKWVKGDIISFWQIPIQQD
jgi:hypothetical protein